MSDEESVSKLEQISGKSDTLEFDGIEFEIEPLTNEELTDYISEMKRHNDDPQKIMQKLCMITLKKDDPNATEDLLNKAPAEFGIKLINKIEQVNGLNDFFSEAEKQEAMKQL